MSKTKGLTRESRRGVLQGYNFRLFIVGQTLSNIGTWFQIIAQALLVLKITGRASSLGQTIALQTLPMLLLGPWAGTVLDRVNVRRLLIVISMLACAEAAALGALTASHHVTLDWVLLLAFGLGLIQPFNRPAAQAILSELVPRERISGAVGVASAVQASGRLGGPALGALIYTWRGPAACFFCNAASYLIVVTALALMRRSEMIDRNRSKRSKAALRDGLRYIRTQPLLADVLMVNVLIGLTVFNFQTVYPAMIRFVFHASSVALGLSLSIEAAAAVTGGMLIARYLHFPTRQMLGIVCILITVVFIWTTFSPSIVSFYVAMVPFGFVMVAYTSISQTLIQQHTQPEYLGRTVSLLNLGQMGTTPIGAIFTGWLTDVVSARASMGLGAVGAALSAVYFLTRSRKERELVTPASS
jgi:MFS family permease